MAPYRVSVIMPTYNRAHVIGRAMDSVLRQSFPIHELIVVDDGSTDATATVVRERSREDARVTYVRQENGGAPSARNRGLAMATGELVAFQDSDDEWAPSFIEKLVTYHTSPGTVAFSSMVTVSIDGERRVEFPSLIVDVESVLSERNCISTQCALLDSKLLNQGGFDNALPRLQDWDLWLGMVGRARFVHHPEPLAIQHLQTDSITSGTTNLYEALRIITRKRWRVLVRHPRNFLRIWVAARVKIVGVRMRQNRNCQR